MLTPTPSSPALATLQQIVLNPGTPAEFAVPSFAPAMMPAPVQGMSMAQPIVAASVPTLLPSEGAPAQPTVGKPLGQKTDRASPLPAPLESFLDSLDAFRPRLPDCVLLAPPQDATQPTDAPTADVATTAPTVPIVLALPIAVPAPPPAPPTLAKPVEAHVRSVGAPTATESATLMVAPPIDSSIFDTASPLAGSVPAASSAAVAPVPAPPADSALIVDRHLDLSRESLWLDRLARDIASAGAPDGKLRFELVPPALGRMEVAVERASEGLRVHVSTQNELTRSIVADAQPRLETALRSEGVRVIETQVSNDAARQQQSQGQSAPAALIEAAPVTPTTSEPKAAARDGRFA